MDIHTLSVLTVSEPTWLLCVPNIRYGRSFAVPEQTPGTGWWLMVLYDAPAWLDYGLPLSSSASTNICEESLFVLNDLDWSAEQHRNRWAEKSCKITILFGVLLLRLAYECGVCVESNPTIVTVSNVAENGELLWAVCSEFSKVALFIWFSDNSIIGCNGTHWSYLCM